MRHPIAAVLFLATLTGCGSEGPNAPEGATGSFSASARVVPVRCAFPGCVPPSAIVIPVKVTESGGILGGYVTTLYLEVRDAASGRPLDAQLYEAAEIASMTERESNHVYPNAWLEIVARPFRIAESERSTRMIFVAVTVTDYHGHEHRQTLDVSLD